MPSVASKLLRNSSFIRITLLAEFASSPSSCLLVWLLLLLFLHLDRNGTIGVGEGRVLGCRDHQDSVRRQVRVDGLRLATSRQGVLALEVPVGVVGALLRLLFVHAFDGQEVVVDVDLQLIRPELVRVERNLELRVVFLDTHQLTCLVHRPLKLFAESEGGSQPVARRHEPRSEDVVTPLGHGPVLLLGSVLHLGSVLLVGYGLVRSATRAVLTGFEKFVIEPVPHALVFAQHFAPQQIEIVGSPGSFKEGIGPEEIPHGNRNARHPFFGLWRLR